MKYSNDYNNYSESKLNQFCLECANETINGYLFCRNCYQDIKNIRNDFNHNRKEKNIQNHYFELRDKANTINDFEKFIENVKLMFALSEELTIIYGNEYLSERVEKDILTLYNQFKTKYQTQKNERIVEEFNDRDYREQWPREYQCSDGHYVRSLSEKNIDDWLYNNGYLHAYEKSVYMDSQPDAIVISDFYLPKTNTYIEFWGIKNDERYEKRKAVKIKLYEENNLNRIDLNEQDIKRLDDIMPRLIAKYSKK